jgi:hypothetical protein
MAHNIIVFRYGGGTDFQESGDPDRNSVIQSYNMNNITLTGGGTIDGQGYPWWACSWNSSFLEKPPCNNISRLVQGDAKSATFKKNF